NGDRWKQPFWAKAHPTPTPATDSAPVAPARPAHRPKGDQAKQIKRLRKRLEQWALESYDRIYYYVDDLSDYLKVSRRATQNYLHILEAQQLIERGQDKGRGGRAWLRLLPAFWGANNSAETPEIAS